MSPIQRLLLSLTLAALACSTTPDHDLSDLVLQDSTYSLVAVINLQASPR